MKLKKEDIKILKSWGFPDSDMEQIERATTKTKYEMNNERISRTKTIEILDRETYLSGISRSAFHWSASRSNDNNETVFFDSSKLFE